MMTCESQGE
jgi:glycosyltransferase involved in cell wall biosynthesis